MTPPVGHAAPRETRSETMARARSRAALIPDLLVEARRVANSVFAGWHGRRKRGPGEDFWQFRHYVTGENMSDIDWRRSARDDSLYVRDREWQATHMIWLWVDESPSMLFKSDFALVAKQSRALVLAFAMAELLARSGERLGWLGLTRPILSRYAADRLGQALMQAPPQSELPNGDGLRSFSDIILFSDFLGPHDRLAATLQSYARRGARGHLVQIVDPVEETFPYAGRVEFTDPETGTRITAGSAQGLKDDYSALFAAHTESVAALARAIGWTHTLHRTDRPASRTLVSLHVHLSQDVWRRHQ